MSNKNKQANIKKLNYLKAVVIVHGKSELQICKFIKEEFENKNGVYSKR